MIEYIHLNPVRCGPGSLAEAFGGSESFVEGVGMRLAKNLALVAIAFSVVGAFAGVTAIEHERGKLLIPSAILAAGALVALAVVEASEKK